VIMATVLAAVAVEAHFSCQLEACLSFKVKSQLVEEKVVQVQG